MRFICSEPFQSLKKIRLQGDPYSWRNTKKPDKEVFVKTDGFSDFHFISMYFASWGAKFGDRRDREYFDLSWNKSPNSSVAILKSVRNFAVNGSKQWNRLVNFTSESSHFRFTPRPHESMILKLTYIAAAKFDLMKHELHFY